MLRDLVKMAKAKKYHAKIDQGGINDNGKTYSPEQFSQLPEGIRRHDASTRVTTNQGLAFLRNGPHFQIWQLPIFFTMVPFLVAQNNVSSILK